MESCENKEFADWLIEQRIDWLVKSQKFFTEEWLTSELESLAICEKSNTTEIKMRLALLIDRLEEERKKLYQNGLTDGITILKQLEEM